MNKYYVSIILFLVYFVSFAQNDDSKVDYETLNRSQIVELENGESKTKAISEEESVAERSETLDEQLSNVFEREVKISDFNDFDDLQVALEAPYAEGKLDDEKLSSIFLKAQIAFEFEIVDGEKIEEVSVRVQRRVLREMNRRSVDYAGETFKDSSRPSKKQRDIAVVNNEESTVKVNPSDKPMLKSGAIPTEDYDELKSMFEELPNGYNGIKDFDKALKQMKIDMPERAEEFEKIRKLK